MTTPTPLNVEPYVAAWADAERAGDSTALDALLHPEFVGIGPFGFVLDRAQWLERFANGLNYTSFDFTLDFPVRFVDGCALVIGTQRQSGDFGGMPADGEFRVGLVFSAGAKLAAVQVSLGKPPEAPHGRSAP